MHQTDKLTITANETHRSHTYKKYKALQSQSDNYCTRISESTSNAIRVCLM